MRCVVVVGEKIAVGLFFVTQGVGRGIVGMNANAVRMIASAGGGLIAIYGFGLGNAWFFAAVAFRLLPVRSNAGLRSIKAEGAGRRLTAWVTSGCRGQSSGF